MKTETDTITIKISELRSLREMCKKASMETIRAVGFLNNYKAELPPEPEIKTGNEGM